MKVRNMQEPQFPMFVFMTATVKDLVDLITFGFLSIITSFMMGLVMFFWILSKSRPVQKMYVRTFLRKNSGWFALEAFPVTGALPVVSFLILRAHKQEKKFVRNTAIRHRDAANDNSLIKTYKRAA